MLDPKIIANAQAFLSRVDLKGNEVPAFVEVVNWLHSLTATPTQPPAKASQRPDEGHEQ